MEGRDLPSSTYLWTGAGTTINWDDPANWSPAPGATGAYPGSGGSTGDVAQFVDSVPGGIQQPAPRVDGAFALSEIDFGTAYTVTILGDGNASHALTVSGLIRSSDDFSANTNADEIAAPVIAGNYTYLDNSAASPDALLQVDDVTVVNALFNTAGTNKIQIGTLTFSGADTWASSADPRLVAVTKSVNLVSGVVVLDGNLTIAAPISGLGGLTIFDGSLVTLSGANTYLGGTTISGGTLNAQSSTALGLGDVSLSGGTLNVSGNTFGTGLPVTWYSWGGTSPRQGAGGNPPAATPAPLLSYAAAQAQLNDGVPYETSATTNCTNSNGAIFEYGGSSGRTTFGGSGNGFPTAIQNNNGNGSSVLGIWQGLFLAQTTNVYDFATGSDDGSLIYVDGNLVVDNNNEQGYTVRDSNNPYDTGATTAPTLTAGVHTILIEYYNGGAGYNFDAFVNGTVLSNSLLGVPMVSLSVGSLAGVGTVNLGANAITVGADGNSTSFSGTLTGSPTVNGAPNVTKAGTGTWTLTTPANLKVTGGLAIAGGMLQIGNGTSTLNALTVSSILDNGTLILDGPNGGSLTYNGNITGSGGITQKGAWTLTLGGNNSYQGATVITAGSTVNATSSTALGSGDVTLPAGSTLNVSAAGTANLGSGLPGKYYLIDRDNLPDSRMNSAAGISAMVAQYGSPIATDTSAFTTANTAGQANTNNNGATFNYGSSPSGFPTAVKQAIAQSHCVLGVWTGVFFASISGTYVFDTASDDGSTLFLDGTPIVLNNFTQGITTRAGAVNLSAGAHAIEIAFYSNTVGYGLWADVELPGTTSFQRLSNAVMGTVAPNFLQLGSLVGAGTINLGVEGGINNGLVVGSDNHSSTFSGTINTPGRNIPGIPTLVKAGSGTFILPSGESYTGQTAISGGVLQLGTYTSAVSGLATSGILDNGNLTVFLPNNTSLTYNGVISGSGGLTIQGTGDIITLGAVNTYAGPTIVGANTIKQGVANALPPESPITIGAGSLSGAIDLNNLNGSIGGITAVGTGTSNVLTNSGASTVNLSLNGTGSIINVNVPISGKLNLAVDGIGTFILSAANSYTGSTTITGAVLKAANSGALPSGGSLNVSATGTLDLGGVSLTVASLSGFGSSNNITNNSTTTSTLTVNGTGAQSFSYTGSITGPVSIVDATGANTLEVLAGGTNNTFTGGVTATSGTVSGVPGSFGQGAITLNGGTAALQASQAIVGFGGNGVGWTVNMNATAAGITGEGGFGNFGTVLPATSTWQATTANSNEAADLICDTPVQPNNGFSATFTYLDNSPGFASAADGIMFLFEADPLGPNVLGGAGGGLGYGSGGTGSNVNGSIKNSMAIALNLYTGAAGGLGTSIQANGAINPCINPSGAFNMLTSGHPINVVLTYNAGAQSLVESVTDTVTGATGFADFYGVNLFSFLGTSTAFIGFSGSTGGLDAQQFISNFTYLGAGGAATAFSNDIQTSAGTTSNLLVQANTLAKAYSTSGNFTVPAGATVDLGADSSSTPNQSYSLTIGGTTTLAGTVNVANNGAGIGTLNLNGPVQGAGTSIGTIGGNVVLGASSTFDVVLGGASAASFTHLTVGGVPTLAGGNLSISYANGFSPALGESFTILASTGSDINGTFGNTPWGLDPLDPFSPSIIVGNVTYDVYYNANSVVLVRATPPQPPSKVTFTVAPSTATAGALASFTVAVTDGSGNVDPFGSDTIKLSSSSGPGTISPTTVTLINGAATVPITFITAGLQTLTAHDVSESLADAMTSVTVLPGVFDHFKVTPLTAPGGQAAGNSFLTVVQAVDANNNTVSSYGGPSSVTVTALGSTPANSSFPAGVPIDSSGFGTALGTLDKVGSYPISTTMFASPAPPSVTIVPGSASSLAFVTQPGASATGVKLPAVSVAIQDPFGNTIASDNTDQVTLSIASGPGSFLASSTVTVPVVLGVATFNNLTLVVPGVYSLAEVVASKYTGPTSHTFFVAPLQVVPGSLVGSPSGFSISFNAPFLVNSTTPVLYGSGFGARAPAPTVTLIGPGGPVEGSVVLNPATNSVTFLETDTANVYGNGLPPQLPDGTYTVSINGTAAGDGLQALNPGGGFLGGTYTGAPGHNFTTTFTVNTAASGADVLWIPATADGPKQALEAPGNNISGGGYPIYLDDFTGRVTSVSVTFNYSPTMLTVTAVSGNPDLPGSSFVLNTALSSPGHAVLTYSGPAADAPDLSGGNVPLGFINATVPNSSAATPIYKGKDLLTLSNLSINGGTIPAVGVNALHLVAFVGDADGNGSYSDADALAITRAALQIDSGFSTYPLVDPVIVADTDGSGYIPPDAALQVNELVLFYPAATLPPPPSPVDVTPIANNVDPTLSLASTASTSGITVSVNLDDAHPAGSTGLIRATLALTFDPGQLALSAADVHAGSLLAGGNWAVQAVVDAATGQIGITLSSDTPIANAGGGSLLTIDFQAVGRMANPSAVTLIASADPNGQPFATELQDTVGMFVLSLM